MKTCKKCLKDMPLENFYIRNIKTNLRRTMCKDCMYEESKQYKQLNKEKISQQLKDYRIKNINKLTEYLKKYNIENKDKMAKVKKKYYNDNIEKIAEYNANYYQKNKEKIKQKSSEYFKENKEKLYKYKKLWAKTENGIINKKRVKANRRDMERKGNIKTAEVKKLIKNSKDVCYWCNSKLNKKDSSTFHLDHYIPLSKGGFNSIDNIVISCPTCNLKKSNKDPYQFALSVGKLL